MRVEMRHHPATASPIAGAIVVQGKTRTPGACHPAKNPAWPSRQFLRNGFRALRRRAGPSSARIRRCRRCPPVGHEENLIAIARPDWTDFVIELAVVITWQIAGSLSSQALHVPEFTTAEIGDENMKMSLVQRGDKRHAFAVG